MTDMIETDELTDRSRIPRCSSDLKLRYPSLPLDLSLESLLAYSSTTATSTFRAMTRSETDTSSLAESWASLAGTEFSHEDDIRSENTDVGSLLDVHSSDDVQSVVDPDPAGDDQDSEEDVEDTLAVASARTSPIDRWNSTGEFLEPSTSTLMNQFDIQPRRSNSDLTSSHPYHFTKHFAQHENQALFHDLNETSTNQQFFGSTRMGLSDEGLDLDTLDYFKVILLGNCIEQFRPEIQRKLGDVLVSHGGSTQSSTRGSVTRFHLVPNTFGPGAEPDFADLVAIDRQIDFECYDRVYGEGSAKGRMTLSLKNKASSSEIVSRWNGREYVMAQSRWIAPDLAVICVDLDVTGKLDESSVNMIHFAERHGIPRIVIRMNRGWKGHYANIQEGHLCQVIKSIDEQPQELQFDSTLPVDMATFLNLDSLLLNKHIAYLVLDLQELFLVEPGNDDLTEGIAGQGSKWRFYNFPLLDRFEKYLPINYFPVPVTLTSILAIFLSFLILAIIHGLGEYSPKEVQNQNILSTSLSTPLAPTVQPAQVPTISIATESLVALARDDDAWRLNSASASLSRNAIAWDSDLHFQVGIAGPGQLMVKLPKLATTRRKQSELSVNLKRGQQTLPVLVQELFEGVYSVTLEPHDSYGEIEVELTLDTHSITETLTLAFGDQPIRGLDRVKVALHDISGRAQETFALLSIYVKQSTNDAPIRSIVHDLHSASLAIKGKIRKIRATLPVAGFPEEDYQVALQTWITEHLTNAGTGIRQTSRDGLSRGQQLIQDASNEVAAQRSILIDRLADLDLLWIKQKVHSVMVVDGLASAQERSRRVVSRAADRLAWLRARLH